VSAFVLSPGITPELADAFVVELPVAVGLGYLIAHRTGFEVAFALNALVLAGIKLVTDFGDRSDALIALATLAGGGTWLYLSFGGRVDVQAVRAWCVIVGAASLVAGAAKLRDFYDPFDVLLSDSAIVAGIAVLLYAWRPASPGRDRVPAPSSHASGGAGQQRTRAP
jgi:hypothetical protein